MTTSSISSQRKRDHHLGHGRVVRRLATGAAVLAAATTMSVVGANAASASAGPCYSGRDDGTTNWAWGSCTGVSGSSHWRLHVSCTWGDTRYSSWFYGNGRTDVQCPVPESVRDTQIDIIY
ncbi:hypothetical protein OHS18_13265 [Amycolatopsis sp. NBC_00355]|uniref:hypothetical protein n=1 Tax=Amycolatopsis sp. NBC_00355 TaxID=2975957 RepID=UPI002E262F4E